LGFSVKKDFFSLKSVLIFFSIWFIKPLIYTIKIVMTMRWTQCDMAKQRRRDGGRWLRI
jgi:hypothetical protein